LPQLGALTAQNSDEASTEGQEPKQRDKAREDCCPFPMPKPIPAPRVQPSNDHQDPKEQCEETKNAYRVNEFHLSTPMVFR
jgi:hypothetical protein